MHHFSKVLRQMLRQKHLHFQIHSPPEDGVSENWKVGAVELIFLVVSKNEVVFDSAPWKSVTFTNLCSQSQNENFENRFFSLPPDIREKNVLRFL